MEPRTDAEVIACSFDVAGRLRRAVRPARDDDVPVLRAPGRPRRRRLAAGGALPHRLREAGGLRHRTSGGAALAVRDREQPPGPPPARRGAPSRRDRAAGEHVHRRIRPLLRGRRPPRRLAALGRRRRRDRHAPAGRARHPAALRLGGHAVRPDRDGARRPGRHGAFAAEPGAWPTPRTRRRERGRTGDSHPSPRPGPPRRRGRPRTVQAREGEAHVHDRNDRHRKPKHGAAHRRCTRASPTRTRSRRSSTSPACSSSPNAAKPGWAAATTRGCSPGSSSATAWS